MNFNLAQA
jgi:pre-rRNA-processing protein TSR1